MWIWEMSNSAIKFYFEEVLKIIEKSFYSIQDQATEFVFR